MKKFFCRVLIFVLVFSIMINLIITVNSFASQPQNLTVSQIIKNSVAKWYLIMRYIVIAFMLLLLICIGIKMAITTVASEKAECKRMLADWLVSMILVFLIHYIMIIILNINEAVVASLEPLATDTSVYAREHEAEYGKEVEIKTSSEVETSLYESARTRAYSLKLTDGFTGMIIYGVLVYYAWRYALMYIKRLFNIMILTLFAPAITGLYAFNKVLHGKSPIFTNWLTEYIINVFIQMIHVILYVSFVSTALRLTLESLPSIIIALVLLSHLLKLDKLLRKIFKLSGNDGGLASSMADKSSFKDLKNDVKSIGNAMVGGAATKAAMGLTYRAATKPFRATTGYAFGKTMEHLANSDSYNKFVKERQAKKEQKVLEEYNKFREDKSLEREENELKEERERLLQEKAELDKDRDKQWQYESSAIWYEDRVRSNEEALMKNEEKMEAREQMLMDEFVWQYQQKATLASAFSDGIVNLLDPKQYVKRGKDGKYHRIKTKRVGEVNSAFWRKKKTSIGKKFFENAKWNKLLNLEEEETKIVRQAAKDLKTSVMGVVGSMVGFPALATNPILGMVLLSQGFEGISQIKKRRKNFRNRAKTSKSSYKFKAFSPATLRTIQNEAMQQIADTEKELTTSNMKKHKKLVRKITESTKIVAEKSGNAVISMAGLGLGISTNGKYYDESGKKVFSIKATGIVDDYDDKLDGIYQKKLRKAFKEYRLEYIEATTNDLINDYENKVKEYEESVKKETETKNAIELMLEEKLSKENTVVIGNTVMEIEREDALTDLMNKAEQIDNSNVSENKKVQLIEDEISKNTKDLIESSLVDICAEKGVTSIEKLDLTISELGQVKEKILKALEKTGILKKDQIKLEELGISNREIAGVFKEIAENSDEFNDKLEEKMVEDACLECILNENITDISSLKSPVAEEQIYEILQEKYMSEDSKKTRDVLKELGANQEQEEYDFPTNMVNKVVEALKKVKKTTSTQLFDEASETEKSRLVERQVNREMNELKSRLEEAVYTEDDTLLEEENQLEMLFLLSEMKKQNEEAEKYGKQAEVKIGLEEKLEYYKQKDTAREFAYEIEDVETKVHGSVIDVIELINKN